jgi:hypothetical protein
MLLSKRYPHKVALGPVGVMLAFNCSATAQEVPPDCPSEDTKPAVILAYLQRDRVGLDARCAERAIRALGLEQYKPAIPTLIDYLDFKKPEPPLRGIGPARGLFPAADALARFHSAVVPALKGAILDDNERKLVRVNAAETYIYIYIYFSSR